MQKTSTGWLKKRVNGYNLLYLNQNLSDQREILTICTSSQIVYCTKISNLLNIRLLRYDRLSVTPSKRAKNERSETLLCVIFFEMIVHWEIFSGNSRCLKTSALWKYFIFRCILMFLHWFEHNTFLMSNFSKISFF